jgi:hypothetical protein
MAAQNECRRFNHTTAFLASDSMASGADHPRFLILCFTSGPCKDRTVSRCSVAPPVKHARGCQLRLDAVRSLHDHIESKG